MILPGSGSTSSNIAAAAYCPKPRLSSASTPKGAWRKGLANLRAPISAFPIPLTTCSCATTADVPGTRGGFGGGGCGGKRQPDRSQNNAFNQLQKSGFASPGNHGTACLLPCVALPCETALWLVHDVDHRTPAEIDGLC